MNSGPIVDLELEFSFTSKGDPKPTIIVGKNGSGKSNYISFVTDALFELASRKFSDVSDSHSLRRKWHRLIGANTIRLGSNFELGIFEFIDDSGKTTYLSKGGKISTVEIKSRIASFANDVNWSESGSFKHIFGETDHIENTFKTGCYASFPPNRYEKPYWRVDIDETESSKFDTMYANILKKPIVIISSLNDIKSWIVDVIFDQLIDVEYLIKEQSIRKQFYESMKYSTISLENINKILSIILEKPQTRIVRSGRKAGNRKLQIFDGDIPFLPTLDSLSSGQSSLFCVFCNILRYADTAIIADTTTSMRGIALIDELDAHLHVDLQVSALPQLVKLFPKIQFIISAHSPMFALGMQRAFGDKGFDMVELPGGRKVSPERYGEFQRSFSFLKETQAFEESIVNNVARLMRPIVLCEGETDPKYLKAAAELLKFNHLVDEVDFDWVGTIANGQARDGGEVRLQQVEKMLKNNPKLLRIRTVLLFDCDTNKTNEDSGLLSIRKIEPNKNNKICNKGIENLFPESIFRSEFYLEKNITKGANLVSIKELRKTMLCDYLCVKERNPANFKNFKSVLEVIELAIWPEKYA